MSEHDDILMRITVNMFETTTRTLAAFRRVVPQFPPLTDPKDVMSSEAFKKCYRMLKARESRLEERSGVQCMLCPIVTDDEVSG